VLLVASVPLTREEWVPSPRRNTDREARSHSAMTLVARPTIDPSGRNAGLFWRFPDGGVPVGVEIFCAERHRPTREENDYFRMPFAFMLSQALDLGPRKVLPCALARASISLWFASGSSCTGRKSWASILLRCSCVLLLSSRTSHLCCPR